MKRVCVLGSNGFVGSNLLKDSSWVGVTREELDLTDQTAVEKYFNEHTYDVVIHCAVIGGSRLKQDDGDVIYKNILMFENVTRVFKGKLIYFSSGAALRGDPPVDPYGLSKWLIDKRIQTIPNAHSLRIWGCYGPGELSTRFSAICRNEGHVVIEKDKYFDFINIEDVMKVVREYIDGYRFSKQCNLVYPKRMKLSEWAKKFGATYDIINKNELDEPYISEMRNDLSQICQAGTVRAKRMFKEKSYSTLTQLESTVEGKLKKNVTLQSIFGKLMPPGSVTGTPKSEAIKIIGDTEKHYRGPYCGAIGIIEPNDDFCFSVGIRISVLTSKYKKYFSGAGIVWDSKPKKENKETLLKAEAFQNTLSNL